VAAARIDDRQSPILHALQNNEVAHVPMEDAGRFQRAERFKLCPDRSRREAEVVSDMHHIAEGETFETRWIGAPKAGKIAILTMARHARPHSEASD